LKTGTTIFSQVPGGTVVSIIINERKTINESGLGSVLFNAISYSPLFAIDQEDEN
mgnify:CR=1